MYHKICPKLYHLVIIISLRVIGNVPCTQRKLGCTKSSYGQGGRTWLLEKVGILLHSATVTLTSMGEPRVLLMCLLRTWGPHLSLPWDNSPEATVYNAILVWHLNEASFSNTETMERGNVCTKPEIFLIVENKGRKQISQYSLSQSE